MLRQFYEGQGQNVHDHPIMENLVSFQGCSAGAEMFLRMQTTDTNFMRMRMSRALPSLARRALAYAIVQYVIIT